MAIFTLSEQKNLSTSTLPHRSNGFLELRSPCVVAPFARADPRWCVRAGRQRPRSASKRGLSGAHQLLNSQPSKTIGVVYIAWKPPRQLCVTFVLSQSCDPPVCKPRTFSLARCCIQYHSFTHHFHPFLRCVLWPKTEALL